MFVLKAKETSPRNPEDFFIMFSMGSEACQPTHGQYVFIMPLAKMRYLYREACEINYGVILFIIVTESKRVRSVRAGACRRFDTVHPTNVARLVRDLTPYTLLKTDYIRVTQFGIQLYGKYTVWSNIFYSRHTILVSVTTARKVQVVHRGLAGGKVYIISLPWGESYGVWWCFFACLWGNEELMILQWPSVRFLLRSDKIITMF